MAYLTRGYPYLTYSSEAYLLEANFIHSSCVRDQSKANQCLLQLKVPGDTNTSLYLSGHREIPTPPYLAEVDDLS